MPRSDQGRAQLSDSRYWPATNCFAEGDWIDRCDVTTRACLRPHSEAQNRGIL